MCGERKHESKVPYMYLRTHHNDAIPLSPVSSTLQLTPDNSNPQGKAQNVLVINGKIIKKMNCRRETKMTALVGGLRVGRGGSSDWE